MDYGRALPTILRFHHIMHNDRLSLDAVARYVDAKADDTAEQYIAGRHDFGVGRKGADAGAVALCRAREGDVMLALR